MPQLTQTPILLFCNVIYSAHVMACLSRSLFISTGHGLIDQMLVRACLRGARRDALRDYVFELI